MIIFLYFSVSDTKSIDRLFVIIEKQRSLLIVSLLSLWKFKDNFPNSKLNIFVVYIIKNTYMLLEWLNLSECFFVQQNELRFFSNLKKRNFRLVNLLSPNFLQENPSYKKS